MQNRTATSQTTVRIATVFYAVSVVLLSFHAASADVVYLNTGGVMRGVIKSADNVDDSVKITLLSGAEVELPVEHVVSQQRRPLKFEEYEVRAELLPDTLDAHWDLAEWCREQKLDDHR